MPLFCPFARNAEYFTEDSAALMYSSNYGLCQRYCILYALTAMYLLAKIVVASLEASEGVRNGHNECQPPQRTYCMPTDMSGSSFHPSFTSLTMSSIHFLSAGVSPTSRSSFGSRNSIAPVSIYPMTSVNSELW